MAGYDESEIEKLNNDMATLRSERREIDRRSQELAAESQAAREALKAEQERALALEARTERLRSVARYRNAADTTPTMESIAFADEDALGAHAARMPNVLAEDTWDLFRVLLR